MREINKLRNKKNYKAIDMKPFEFKRTWSAEKADIVLTRKKDLTDFIALGLYCLSRSLKDPENRIIRVCYATVPFWGNSGVKMIVGKTGYSIPKNALEQQVYDHVEELMEYMARQNHANFIAGGQIYPEVTAYANGKFSNQTFDEIFPEEWNIKYTVMAQQVAYELLVVYLNILYP